MAKNPHHGSSFEDFLAEEGLNDATATARSRVFELLAEHGDDLSKPRDVDHFAYFPTQETRASYVEKCVAAGFRLRALTEPAHGLGLGAIVFHLDIPEEDALAKIIFMLTDVAAECGGKYDGWETQILMPEGFTLPELP